MPTLLYKNVDDAIPAFNKPYVEDAGYDMYATEKVFLWPFQTKKVPLNFRVAIPADKFGWLTGRSSAAAGGLLVHAGIIDSGYIGQIRAVVTNLSFFPRVIQPGQRIAQLIFLDKPDVVLQEANVLPVTQRNARGFGSSGA